MWRYSYNLRGLYETPALPEDSADWTPDRARSRRLSSACAATGRTILTEFESKQLLAAYGIPTVATRIAADEAEAVQAARADRLSGGAEAVLGDDHAQDRCGRRAVEPAQTPRRCAQPSTRSRRRSREKAGAEHFQGVTVQPMVKLDGYELIIGSSLDPQFGPVLLFGTGGQLVEVFKDRALALPPLNTTLARRMMEQTKIYKALKGVRGRQPVDMAALEHCWCASASWWSSSAWIKEIDINPLLASPDRLHRAGRAGRAARPGRRRRTAAAAGDPALSDAVRRRRGRMKDGDAGDDPPDPPRGRAADGRSSTRRSPSAASTCATSTR